MGVEFYSGLNLDEKAQELIRESIRLTSGESVLVVHAGFPDPDPEPRIHVFYDLYRGEKREGSYEHTLVLDDSGTELREVVDQRQIS